MTFTLAHSLIFDDLHTHAGLSRLDGFFCDFMQQKEPVLAGHFLQARANPDALNLKDESALLIALAPFLEEFLAHLFSIEPAWEALLAAHTELAPLYVCKRLFVQRRVAKQIKPAEAQSWRGEGLEAEICSFLHAPLSELCFAQNVMRWLEQPDSNQPALDSAARYAAWALFSPEGQAKHVGGLLFKEPAKIDPANLVTLEYFTHQGVRMARSGHTRVREGFDLTDGGGSLARALDEANYCIHCHHQSRDSCSKGFKDKEGHFRHSVQQVELTGCPLEEKISEMHELKSKALPIAALAVAVVDNPMIAGTGHRICNDCMKACIFQKQEPVNIPLAETRILEDVLGLPYGFEIYSLLTRWNPLNLRRPLPKPQTGHKVLVAGMGPAGYTLSHYLLNDGHTVVGIDGLKIEPFSVPFEPIERIHDIYENLSERISAGFGGVAEYGITVRWNKNYLTLIRMLLERRAQFALFGGVRFGGTITHGTAFELGFDHIALCLGAGRPRILDIPNGMAKGVRAASDFLMALQLTGAARKESIANLQLRLPVVVIGGGLTAIDTATEALAYYPVQVEKFLSRYEILLQAQSDLEIRAPWTAEDKNIAEEFLQHAYAIRKERATAAEQGRPANILGLLQDWGGVTLCYRQTLQDAPSYRLNHEEVTLAMEEGIYFREAAVPEAVKLDADGHASAIRFNGFGETFTLPAKSILVAAGTSPNTVLAREMGAPFKLDGAYFQTVDAVGEKVTPARTAKPDEAQMLLAKLSHGSISFFGDLHPSFSGNVVKAMASAKRGAPLVTREVLAMKTRNSETSELFFTKLEGLLRATVHQVNRLTPTIIEVVIKAPLAAGRFEPGQFYRLQNFETNAIKTGSTRFSMEGLAMTGAWVDKEAGLISVIILEMGGSSNVCAQLKIGEPIVLMGPTGTPTEIPQGKTVLLAGGGLGNAVLFSIGRAMRESGCRVLYFAGYKHLQDRYKTEEIEAAADVVIWCSDEAPGFVPARPQDKSFTGTIVQAMLEYAKGKLGGTPILLSDVEHLIAIGSDRMMQAVALARHDVLAPYLHKDHEAIGSINSPMQCMMKEICAQCLQQHVDPATGKITYVFSCTNQDQKLDHVSFPHLAARLAQNHASESLTASWLKSLIP